jgi:hypothetical protein
MTRPFATKQVRVSDDPKPKSKRGAKPGHWATTKSYDPAKAGHRPPGGPGSGNWASGPAKGANPATPRQNWGQSHRPPDERAARAAAREARIEKVKAVLEEIALNPEEVANARVAAATAYLNRELGTPVQSVKSEVTGADGGPLQIDDTRKPITELLSAALNATHKPH